MRGLVFNVDCGAHRAPGLIDHAVQKNAVGTELCRLLLEALDNLVHFAGRCDGEGSAAGSGKICDLLVRRFGGPQVDPHLIRRYRRPYPADEDRLRGSASGENRDHQGADGAPSPRRPSSAMRGFVYPSHIAATWTGSWPSLRHSPDTRSRMISANRSAPGPA